MARQRDTLTPDLFALPTTLPQPAPERPGSMDYRAEVAHEVSEMFRASGLDRYEISSKASRLTGRLVSKCMLDGYTSESREEFNVCLALAPVLEAVCRSTSLTAWAAEKRGAQLMVGRDAIAAELGRLEEESAKIAQARAILRGVLKSTRT